MKEIKFRKIRAENYGPYVDPIELEFLDNKMILITGPNGIGKTMLLDAIPFALFGNTSKGMTGDAVVNNITGKNCKVSLDFTVGDEKYNVTRYQKYRKYGNTVILSKGKEQLKAGHREVLPAIELLITNRNVFPNTRMFGQQVKDFFTDLPDSKKKAIFKSVLNLEKWDAYYEKAKDKHKAYAEDISACELRISTNERLIEETNQQIELQIRLKAKFEEDIKNRIAEQESAISNSKTMLKNWKSQLDKVVIEDDLQSLTEKLYEIRSRIKDIDDRYDAKFTTLDKMKSEKIIEVREKVNEALNHIREKYKSEIEKLTEELEVLTNEREKVSLAWIDKKNEANRAADKIENDYLNEENNRDSILEALNLERSFCPTCKQEISKQSREHLQKELEKHETNISQLKEKHLKLKEEIKKIIHRAQEAVELSTHESKTKKSELDLVKAKRLNEEAQINEKLQDTLSQIDRAAMERRESLEQEKIQEKESLSTSYRNLAQKIESVKKAEDQKSSIEESIKNIENEIKNYEQEIKRLKKQEFNDETRIEAVARKDRYEKELGHLREKFVDSKSKLEMASFWKSAYSPTGIPSMLIDDAIPFMNDRVQYYLDQISDGRYIVSFDTLSETKGGDIRDKISVHFLDTKTKANMREQLSGGQTRIVDIATILTLGELQENIQDIKFNLLMFDEVFDSLDDENINYVSKIMRKLVKDKTIVVISHRHIDQLEADDILELHG
jgi:exonuclease SbcC